MGRTAQISLAAAGPNQPQGFDICRAPAGALQISVTDYDGPRQDRVFIG